MTPRLSVALCTFNGERYLAEQLASIAVQTTLPDELIACDDCSSDHTVEILRQFAASAPFPVTVRVNEQRREVNRNFDHAIGLCSGDLIALADQDDVWRPEKLERLSAALERDSEAGLAFTDAEVVDEALRPLGYGLWETIGFSPREQRHVETAHAVAILLRHPVVTGATLAFRAGLRDLICPIPETWFHDAWIALLVAGVGRLAVVPERLVLYRQHGANQIGGRRVPIWRLAARADRDRTRRRLMTEAQALENARARLRRPGVRLADPRALYLIGEALAHLQARAKLPIPRLHRVPGVAREVLAGRYRRYSDGLVSVMEDLVL